MLKRTVCHALLIGICVWLGGMIGFGYTINHLRTDADAKTDAIVVLTGGRNRIGEAAQSGQRRAAFDFGRVERHFAGNPEKTPRCQNYHFPGDYA